MKICILFAAAILANNAYAQNVGIGTTTPTDKLTVKSDGIAISQESSDASSRVGFYTAPNLAYVQTHSNQDLNFSTNNGGPQLTLQKTTGFFGVNNSNPTARLDVNGPVKITDGTQGDKKVLTSDGTGLASWRSAAYSNNVRFAISDFSNSSSHNGNIRALYNINSGVTFNRFTTSDSIKSKGMNITVPVTGLYHLKIFARSRDGLNCQISTDNLELFMNAYGTSVFDMIGGPVCASSATTLSSTFQVQYELDIQLQAGVGVGIQFFMHSDATGSYAADFSELTVVGNLISE